MNTAHYIDNRYDVIVIGGGHNGLTAAAMMAKQGRKVVLLERRDALGGLAAGEEFHPGYSSAGLLHDTSGVRPGVIDALNLEACGLELTTGPPPIFAPQLHGPGLLHHYNANEAASEIAAHSSTDAGAYAKYRDFLGRIRRFTDRMLRELPPDLEAEGFAGFTEFMGGALALRRLGAGDMMELLRIAPMCVSDWLGEWFECELLKCVLAGPAISATFTGPRSPGSNFNLLRWEAAAGRAVRKGPQALIAALEYAARKMGVEIRTGVAVQKIRVDAGRVTGVLLAEGETLDADVVASSCDPKRTFLKLIEPQHVAVKLEHRIQKFRTRGTTAAVHLAMNAPLRFACRSDLNVEFARIGETLNGAERAFDAVKYRKFSSEPVLDVYVPTVANSALAPAGHCVVSILAHFAPYDLEGGWTDARREELGDTITGVLAKYAPDVSAATVAREVLTPLDIENRYGVTQGHVHHGEHGVDQLLVRPSPECARYKTPIDGLYLCGSGAHPGGGLTCAPGALAAAAILKNNRPT